MDTKQFFVDDSKIQYNRNCLDSLSGFIVWIHRRLMIIVVVNGYGDRSSNPGKTDSISHSTNTLGEGMNPIILPPFMRK